MYTSRHICGILPNSSHHYCIRNYAFLRKGSPRIHSCKDFSTLQFLDSLEKKKKNVHMQKLERKKKRKKETLSQGDRIHVMAFSDLVALWVIRIKDWFFAHVVCRDHVTSSTKCRSHSESTLKVCFFSSQNNKIWWLSNVEGTSFEKWTGAQRFVDFFSWLCFSDADWLGRKTVITWST